MISQSSLLYRTFNSEIYKGKKKFLISFFISKLLQCLHFSIFNKHKAALNDY